MFSRFRKQELQGIGLVGFEPTASWSRTRRSTKLSHSPKTTCRMSRRALLTSRILVQIASSIELGGGGSPNFGYSDLFRDSNFGFRISELRVVAVLVSSTEIK